jgi:peroxiredoxin (alkyl hydroperoxide reductase subunit C)
MPDPADRSADKPLDTRLPRIGEAATPFTLRTTLGVRGLAGYRGRWLYLFSHPADFTPVCTSEFVALARVYPRFQALGCDLLGLSVDSLFSHVAWLHSIRESFGVTIPFPIGEDISMAIAAAYGMIHAGDNDTGTVRASFLIDPKGIVRYLSFYPMANGRNVEEVLRLLAAMRETDATGLSTPADWQPGSDGLLAPPTTLADADLRTESGAVAWYFKPGPSSGAGA